MVEEERTQAAPEEENPDRPATPEELQELVNAMTSKYKLLTDQNQRRLAEINGKGVALNQVGVLRARVELLLEMIMPLGTIDRMRFEIAWQQQFAEIIEQVYGEHTRNILMNGGNLHGMPRR